MTDTPNDPDAPKPDDNATDDFEFKPLHGEEGETSAPVPSEPDPVDSGAPIPAAPPPPSAPSSGKEWLVRNKTLALFLAFALVGGGMWAVSALRDQGTLPDAVATATAVDEVPVNVIEARLGRFQDRIDAVGNLRGEAEVELRFGIDGIIEELNMTEGDRVSRGQIVGRLDDRSARLKVQQARNEVEKSEQLFRLGGISGTKLEETRLAMHVAQRELERTQLRAPREGIIGDKAADVGEFVTPQRKIATLVAIQNVSVKVGVIERQVDKVYPGQKMLVTVDAYPASIFEGTIASISPIITGEAKTFELTARIPNPDSLLLPGMFARAQIITYEADDAISIPNDALVKAGGGGFQVFVISKENTADARDVTVGYVADEYSQILSGLSPGEVVVVQRPPELKSGSKVRIIEVQSN